MEAVVGVVSENGSADWSVREPIGTCQRLKVELLFVGLFFFCFFFRSTFTGDFDWNEEHDPIGAGAGGRGRTWAERAGRLVARSTIDQ